MLQEGACLLARLEHRHITCQSFHSCYYPLLLLFVQSLAFTFMYVVDIGFLDTEGKMVCKSWRKTRALSYMYLSLENMFIGI